MSELLDSLRRAQTARRVPGTWGWGPDTGGLRPRGKGAAALLATMGYGSRRRHPARLAAAVAVGFVTLGMLGAYLFALSPRPSDPSRTPLKIDTDHRPVPTAGSVPQGQPAPRPPAPAPPPSDDFRRALSHQRAGEFEAAIRLYESLLARGELRAQIHNNLGLIHQQRGRIDEATRHLEQAISSDPQYARAHNNLGVLLLGQNRIVQARALFRTAADLDPRDPDAIVNLALAQQAAGRLEEAKESLLSALTLSPHSAPAHYNLAVIYDQAGEAARALEHYTAFLEYRGDDYPGRVTGVRTRIAALDKKR